MTFGKVMGGGFPAAAFGGRADVMSRLAPDGPVYQAGTLSGNPIATTAGLATLPPRDRRRVRRPVGETADTIRLRGRRRAHRRRGAPPPTVGRARCSRSSSPTARSATSPAPAGRTPRRSRRSSTPCSRAGSTSRRRRTRRGSCRRPTTTAPSRPSSTRCPRPPCRAPPQRWEPLMSARRSSTCSATARSTTPRASSTAAATASTSPTSAPKMADRIGRDDRRPRHRPPASRRRSSGPSETSAPLAAARGLDAGARPAGHRVGQQVRGHQLRRRRR